MSLTNKTYWRGFEELEQSPEFVKNAKQEFPDYLPSESENGGHYRRDFLKMMGFGVAAATLAACETPVRKAIPYLNKPEDVDATIPNYYASTYAEGGDYCSIIVKTREGRPIKIEGNKNSSISKGGISARVAASVLSLYDKERFRNPMIDGNKTTWDELDSKLGSKLQEVASSGKKIAIVSNTVLSISLQQAINEFVAKYPTAMHLAYDTNSASGILDANEKSFGVKALPSYDFSKAMVIVSFGADFLGTWVSPVQFQKDYSIQRKLSKDKKTMSRHYQFETTMSLTGSNADFRTSIKPSQELNYIAQLHNAVSTLVGGTQLSGVFGEDSKIIKSAAKDLVAAKGKSLVVSGSNNVAAQLIVNNINQMLGNYGSTLSISNPSYFKKGSDSAIDTLLTSDAGAVIFINANPVYDAPKAKEIKALLAKIAIKVSIADRPNETSALCNFIAPDNHYLESWSDAKPADGLFSLTQPTISPLFKTRQSIESLNRWSGGSLDAYSYVQYVWRVNIFPTQTEISTFQSFWDKALYNGVYENAKAFGVTSSYAFDINAVSAALSGSKASTEIEYTLYEKVGIGNGSQANNPWLQEFPEPISKATWDNYVTVSKTFANEKGLEQGDKVKVTSKSGVSVVLPVLIQPGQAANTVSMAVGYGREVSGKVANGVGANVFTFINAIDGKATYSGVCTIEKTGEKYELAQTQTHQTMMSRPIVQETTLADYVKDPSAGRYKPMIKTSDGEKSPEKISIWDTKGLQTHNYNNHFWGLAIDLNSCTGCGSCVISCQAENNVPVVGKREVINRREMHWIRIDRYYTSDAVNQEDKSVAGLMDTKREDPSENPQVVFQPVMCQHCNNAPCETVCPVLATTHSTEGLNQMTYNRCVGTRYCANNCPYKVRRFNWFSYYTNDKFAEINPAHDARENEGLGKMVLNPDVTVRARGVMEKCSMCVQRIQSGKLAAKIEKRRPIDGEIETACSQSCPSEAIVFGDMNDPQSRISKLLNETNQERAYHLLEEINVKPSVSYLTKIRNV
ncbi:MAG: 4Fe-4S dicluster domain-containing protein [Bacteroidetes bacterium]|nr:MAG: 4Fe-4S dicluster domain-containing protein [Bacteroidota bacterium]